MAEFVKSRLFGDVAKLVILECVDMQVKENLLLDAIKHNAFINAEERAVFFTHSDHLGSVSWITDENAKCIQYIHYAPFGELMDNQRAISYDERFKFTGKERDEESGYDYFGARYYASTFSLWLSVDPLADNYPNISPYAYCNWNPLKYIDPDGKEINVAGNFISCFLGRIGVKNFQGKVYRALDRLKDIDPDIHKMILQLEASNITYTIKPTFERSDGESGNAYNPKTKTIYFDPDNAVKKNGEVRDPIVGLAHELGHAEDDNGQVMLYNRDNALKGDAKEREKLNKIEKNAIMRENTVREKLDLQKRNETYIE